MKFLANNNVNYLLPEESEVDTTQSVWIFQKNTKFQSQLSLRRI